MKMQFIRTLLLLEFQFLSWKKKLRRKIFFFKTCTVGNQKSPDNFFKIVLSCVISPSSDQIITIHSSLDSLWWVEVRTGPQKPVWIIKWLKPVFDLITGFIKTSLNQLTSFIIISLNRFISSVFWRTNCF